MSPVPRNPASGASPSDQERAGGDSDPEGRPPRRKKRPAASSWTRRLIWILGTFVVLGASAVFGLRIWVTQYLKSPGFADQLNQTAGRFLQATCHLEDVTWRDTAMHAGSFMAEGTPESAFRRLSLSDLRADLDTGALWDRVWKVSRIRIPQMTADFSPAGRIASLPPAQSSPSDADPGSGSVNWLQRWLPDRAEIGPVSIYRFDFIRHPGPSTHPSSGLLSGGLAAEGRGFALQLKPDLRNASMVTEGRGGELKVEGLKSPLLVSRLRATIKKEATALDYLEGTVAGAGFSADGTAGLGKTADLRMNVRVTGAALDQWLPEDWLQRCSGEASGKALVLGDARRPETLRAEGSFQIRMASLQALPMLDIIAKKTRNATFLRLMIKEASGDFDYRHQGQWVLRRLRADAPGLLRLKGQAEISSQGALSGPLLLGIVPGTLRYLAGAEQSVFVPAAQFSALPGNAGALEADDTGLLWARFTLGGTLKNPSEDLSERLARAWFNATVQEVQSLSMEAAATAARTAADAAGTAAGAAGQLLDHAPPVLRQAPDLLNQGIQGGMKTLDGLLPR